MTQVTSNGSATNTTSRKPLKKAEGHAEVSTHATLAPQSAKRKQQYDTLSRAHIIKEHPR